MFANSPCGLTLTALAAAAAWSEAQHQLSGYPGFVHIRGSAHEPGRGRDVLRDYGNPAKSCWHCSVDVVPPYRAKWR